jgi:predicted dehydrogenase
LSIPAGWATSTWSGRSGIRTTGTSIRRRPAWRRSPTLPKIPWDPKRYFNRFAYWDLSTGGQTGGLFVHMVDVVHWYLGLQRAQAAVAAGGIYQYKDGRDTPDNINLLVEYPKGLVVSFEATLSTWIDKQVDGLSQAQMGEKTSAIRKRTSPAIWRRMNEADIVFHGTGGRLSIFRSGYVFTPWEEGAELGEAVGGGAAENSHMRNWLDSVRTRKDPNATVEDGHYSSMACHIGNIAYQTRRRVEWRPEWDV